MCLDRWEFGAVSLQHGMAGVVVNGCVRDVDEIKSCDVGVRAFASHPTNPTKEALERGMFCSYLWYSDP